MEDLFRSYWWLVFSLGAFIYGVWDRWLAYQRSKDTLELIKAYAAQGRDPPPELVRRLEDEEDEEDDWTGVGRDRRWRRRHWRYRRRDDVRSAIFSGALAGAFWIASELSVIPGTEGVFRLVALILAFVSGATLLSGVLSRNFRGK